MTTHPIKTEAELEAYLDKFHQVMKGHNSGGAKGGNLTPSEPETSNADPGPEARLSGKIQKYCKDKGYPCQINRQSRKASGMLTPGWPDCTILAPGGRVLLVELKAAKGRMSDEQKRLKLQAMALGHEVHEVRSFRKFLEIILGG